MQIVNCDLLEKRVGEMEWRTVGHLEMTKDCHSAVQRELMTVVHLELRMDCHSAVQRESMMADHLEPRKVKNWVNSRVLPKVGLMALH